MSPPTPIRRAPARVSNVTDALAADRLGVPAVVFFVMSAATPLTVVAGVVTLAYAITGRLIAGRSLLTSPRRRHPMTVTRTIARSRALIYQHATSGADRAIASAVNATLSDSGPEDSDDADA